MTSSSDEMTTQEFIQRLLAPERAQRVDTFSVFAFSEINDRDTVADIGCGPGYFTIPLAKAVYNGKLFALDINDEMLAACRQRVEEARLGNVEVLKCREFEFPVKEGSLNGAFLAFVVQQSPDKPRFLEAVRELLRPRGWCTILEWYHKKTETGPPLERRIDPADLQEMATAAGFQCRTWRDLNGEQYMMTLRKG
jgi:ubiquinone/menaquinone biosynthesis C-methylase UbiE